MRPDARDIAESHNVTGDLTSRWSWIVQFRIKDPTEARADASGRRTRAQDAPSRREGHREGGEDSGCPHRDVPAMRRGKARPARASVSEGISRIPRGRHEAKEAEPLRRRPRPERRDVRAPRRGAGAFAEALEEIPPNALRRVPATLAVVGQPEIPMTRRGAEDFVDLGRGADRRAGRAAGASARCDARKDVARSRRVRRSTLEVLPAYVESLTNRRCPSA